MSTDNQDMGGWDTAKVTNMREFFVGAAAINDDTSSWRVSALTDAANMFSGVTLSTVNYNALLKVG